uniref:Uncharacterized protein n=1 Tax=viral metagenome TaxID=1070528 RepID=A0A6C0HU12_9ZZZZ
MKTCKRYYLGHKGNTFTRVKYAMQCSTLSILKKTKKILQELGFKLVKEEKDKFKHTFLTFSSFLIILSIGKSNTQKLTHPRVGSHLGFKVSKKTLHKLSTCKYNSMIVEKPDETSFFIELPCGEVLEFSG